MWSSIPKYGIHVYNCRAVVVRRVELYAGSFQYEPAANWEELEEDAIEAVEAQGGALNWSGLYYCPSRIIQRAEWPQSD